MAKAYFYTQSNKGQQSANILFQLKWSGTGLTYSTGKSIPDKKYWDKEMQRIAFSKDTREIFKLNDTLDEIQKLAEGKLVEEQRKATVPDPKVIKDALDIFLGKKKKPDFVKTENLIGLISKIAEGKINPGGKKLTVNTKKSYTTLKAHILEFDSEANFDSVTIDWWESYKEYFMEDDRCGFNSMNRDMKLLKAIMRRANDKGYSANKSYTDRDFACPTTDIESTYLKIDQVEALRGNGLAVDYFILACETGARFSDWDQFKKENVKDGFFTYTQQKTGVEVTVKCTDLFNEVFRSNMRPCPNYWITNRAIKKVCGKSPHEARRSCVTNLYISGMPVQLIMKISGHSTEAAFMKYLKLDLETSRKLQREFAESRSISLLKVV